MSGQVENPTETHTTELDQRGIFSHTLQAVECSPRESAETIADVFFSGNINDPKWLKRVLTRDAAGFLPPRGQRLMFSFWCHTRGLPFDEEDLPSVEFDTDEENNQSGENLKSEIPAPPFDPGLGWRIEKDGRRHWVSVPGFQQAAGAIHEECLAAAALKVAEDPQKEGLLRYLIDWEEHATEERRLWSRQTSGGSADVSWEWKEVNIPSYKIRSLLDVGLAAVVFSTNKSTNYALVGRQVIKEALGKVDQTVIAPPEAVEIPNDLFDCIVGYDDIKEEMKLTITGSRKNHYLLIGPPATSKSLFLMELGRLGDTYAATGSRVTAAGLTDAFFAYQPKVLLLDEIDKIPMDATAVLLSAMETGDILVTKYKTHRQLKLDVIVFAAGNTDRTIAPELLSRFDTKLYFPPYTFKDFITVCRGYLSRYEDISDTIAKYIGTQTWNLLDKDVRTARGIARRLREPTTADVDRVVGFLRRYAKES